MQQVAPLLNHLVGDGEQPWWEAEAESQKSIETVSQTERCNITGSEPAAAVAHRTRTPGVAGPIRRPGKRIGSAKAAAGQDRRLIALVERGIAAVVVEALTGIGRAPASFGPRRLAPLRARPALGVSVGEQQSHYCDTEQNKTDRAHGSSPSPCFRAAKCKRRGGVVLPAERIAHLRPAGGAALRGFDPAYARFGSIASDQTSQRLRQMSAMPPIATNPVCHIELSRSANRAQARRRSKDGFAHGVV